MADSLESELVFGSFFERSFGKSNLLWVYDKISSINANTAVAFGRGGRLDRCMFELIGELPAMAFSMIKFGFLRCHGCFSSSDFNV